MMHLLVNRFRDGIIVDYYGGSTVKAEKFSTNGKKVVVADSGYVVRVKGSKSDANKSAEHLNQLHRSKLQGYCVRPTNSY
jgi:hypothetical protein